MADSINPSHYQNHPSGVECIEITEHMGFNLGNAVKYIWGVNDKHESPIEDLNKAAWYIQREIKRQEEAATTFVNADVTENGGALGMSRFLF